MREQKIRSDKKFSSISPPTSTLLPPKSGTDREMLKSPKCRNLSTLTIFNKQPLYKQLALEWQIAKQL